MPRVPRGLHRHAGSLPNVGQRNRRIYAPPQEHYWRRVQGDITQGQAQTTIAGNGSGTVRIGPQGLGTRWYITQVNIQTASGATDVATFALYLGAQVASNLLGSSYAGGQDTIGLNGRALQPGDLLTGVWTGGHPGDTATLTVYGDQTALNNL